MCHEANIVLKIHGDIFPHMLMQMINYCKVLLQSIIKYIIRLFKNVYIL